MTTKLRTARAITPAAILMAAMTASAAPPHASASTFRQTTDGPVSAITDPIGAIGDGAAATVIGAPRPRIAVSPDTVTATSTGDISFAVYGSGVPPRMPLVFHSNGLKAACVSGFTLDGNKTTADRHGRFTTTADGRACVPGTYLIEVTETQTPLRTYYTTVHLNG